KVTSQRNRYRGVEQRYIGRQAPDRLKRFDAVTTACDDVKVLFRAEDADQAAQKHRAPISNDHTDTPHDTSHKKQKYAQRKSATLIKAKFRQMLRVTHGRRLDSLLLRVVDGYVRSHNVVTTALMAGIPKDRLLKVPSH